jgi:hypothetical protein
MISPNFVGHAPSRCHAELEQPVRIDVSERIATHIGIGIGIDATREANGIALDISSSGRIVVTRHVVREARFLIVILCRVSRCADFTAPYAMRWSNLRRFCTGQ